MTTEKCALFSGRSMDPNKIYNRILDFIGFVLTVLFVIGKILNWFDASWWWILFPILVPSFFHVAEDYEEDDDEIPWWRKW